MAKIGASMRISPELNQILDRVDRKLVLEVLPRALQRAAEPVKKAIIVRLPDSRETGTKALQSESAQKRFPTHMVEQVGSKTVTDEAGVLKIIGVTDKAKQVRFDHGDKAKTIGRNHILWGNRPKPPRLRRQLHDIPLEVYAETKGLVSKIITDTIINAVRNGEL